MAFGGFKVASEPGRKVPLSADDRDLWITRLDDGSFFVEFRGGQFAHQRFHGYDVVLANGRPQRRAAGSPDATHRIFVTSSGARRVTELSYPAAHMLTYLEVEQQLYEADPLQG